MSHLLQILAARAIGVPAHKVLTRVKRLGMMYGSIDTPEYTYWLFLGGGFGGKETRNCMFSTALAVAANK